MKNGETIGIFNYDDLIIDGKHSLDVKGVTVASGQGKLSRGTILAINAAGKAVILGTEESDKKLAADCILTDDIDATKADVYTAAYESGNFNKNALIVKEGYNLAADDVAMLRTKGIFTESGMN